MSDTKAPIAAGKAPTAITEPTPIPAPSEPASRPADRLTLVGATALVVGSIVGVGIFNLPSSLAPYGPITLVSMGLTTIGALALARLFASLARRMPADGGPYAYARVAFGNKLGFANAWSYWITAWAGNAAIAVGWVLYVEVFINKGQTKLWSILLVLVGLWIPAFINLSGLKNMGWFQVATTITKFAALAFMSIVGLFYINTANYSPFNVSGHSAISAVGSGMAIALFSYLGLETAAVAAKNVRDPDRNIPRSTLLGTFATAVVYMLSLFAVFGIVSNHALQKSTAPFSTAVNAMFGGTVWGNVMAAVVIISGIGALNGWTMITRRDAARGRARRRAPETVRPAEPARDAGLRDRRLDRARLDRDDHQLPGLQRADRLHDAGADDRHHRGDPLRLLGGGADQMAPRRQEEDGDAAVRPRHDRRGPLAGVLGPVHLLLA